MNCALHTIDALNLSPDVGTAPRPIIDFIGYNPLFARHSTWVTRSSRPIPFDAIHRCGSVADTPSSASAVMDSRLLPVYHREPLSLLSERSLVA